MVHSAKNNKNNSTYLKRLALDEIISNLLVLSKNRKKFKKILKKNKLFKEIISNQILNNLSFKLTNNQKTVINEINFDLNSDKKMFRILQGDVGSGKTITLLFQSQMF